MKLNKLQVSKSIFYLFKTFSIKVCFLIVLFCFISLNIGNNNSGFGQNLVKITVNAQDEEPEEESKTEEKPKVEDTTKKPTTPTATTKPATPDTKSTGGGATPDSGILKGSPKATGISDSAKISDVRIGVITKCDSRKAPTSPEGANTFIYECVKDVINIIIGVSVILAVISIMALGVQSLNSFENQTALNKQIAERLQGFAVGASILGLFAAMISFINPTALKFDKIFSPSTIKNYQELVTKSKSTSGGFFSDLAKGVTGDTQDKTASKEAPVGKTGTTGGGSTTTGSGGGKAAALGIPKATSTGGGDSIGKSFENVLSKQTPEAKTKMKNEYKECLNEIGLPSVVYVSTCEAYKTIPYNNNLINSQAIKYNYINGDTFANGDFNNFNIDTDGNATGKYTITRFGKQETKTLSFNVGEQCQGTFSRPKTKEVKPKISVKKGEALTVGEKCTFTDVK